MVAGPRAGAPATGAVINRSRWMICCSMRALGVILGGRLGYILFYDFDSWLSDPLQILRVWEGGMSFHGGFLGVLVAMWWYGRRIGKRFFASDGFHRATGSAGAAVQGGWATSSMVNCGARRARCPGRCRLSCSGNPGLCSDKLQLPPGSRCPRRCIRRSFMRRRSRVWCCSCCSGSSAPDRARPWRCPGLFLLGYGLFRFMVEFLRMPDAHLGYLAFGWVTMGQLLSAPMMLAGVCTPAPRIP